MPGHIPLLLAEAARALPLLPLEWTAQRLMANAVAARPQLLSRLHPHAGATFELDPLDCPFVFLLTVDSERPVLQVRRKPHRVRHTARIGAPLLLLLGLLDGTYDGDALFFSRDLVFEGDTEAVLALRNAIENAELDPATVAGIPRPLQAPFNTMSAAALAGLRRALGAPQPGGSDRIGGMR